MKEIEQIVESKRLLDESKELVEFFHKRLERLVIPVLNSQNVVLIEQVEEILNGSGCYAERMVNDKIRVIRSLQHIVAKLKED